jgi:hypothetical protein
MPMSLTPKPKKLPNMRKTGEKVENEEKEA